MYQGRDKSDKAENQSKPRDVRSDGIVFIDCVFFLQMREGGMLTKT